MPRQHPGRAPANLLALISTLAVCGCGSGHPEGAARVRAPSHPARRAVAAPVADADYLVWSGEDQSLGELCLPPELRQGLPEAATGCLALSGRKRHQTAWIRVRRGQARLVAQRPGLVLAVGQGLRVLSFGQAPVMLSGYSGPDRFCTNIQPPYVVGYRRTVSLRALGSRQSQEVSVPEAGEGDSLKGYEQEVTVVGSVGAHLLLLSKETVKACADKEAGGDGNEGGTDGGAGGDDDRERTTMKMVVWDLKRGVALDATGLRPWRKVLPVAKRHLATIERTLSRILKQRQARVRPPLVTKLRATALWPRYDRRGRLTLRYLVSADLCAACQAPGDWAPGTMTLVLRSEALPRAFVPHAVLPAPLRQHVARLPKGRLLGGVTRLPQDAARRTPLLRLFESLPQSPRPRPRPPARTRPRMPRG